MVSNITTIDDSTEVLKYVLKYNCRVPYTKCDLKIMRSVEDQVLSWLVNISNKLDPIIVYDNYVEALDHMEHVEK